MKMFSTRLKLGVKFLSFLLIFGCASQKVENSRESLSVASSTTTIAPTTNTTIAPTTTTTIADSRLRRGVVRRNEYYAISIVQKYDDAYTNIDLYPQSEKAVVIDIRYPKLKESISCSEIINKDIVLFVESNIKRQEDQAPTEQDLKDWGYSSSNDMYKLHYDIIEISDYVVSILFSDYDYNTGAAHGMGGHYTFNYDLTTCEHIGKPNFLEVFESYGLNLIQNEINLQLCSPETIDICSYKIDRLDFFTDKLTVFAVSEKGLFVQFWEYEFGYAGGAELILLPWYDIAQFVKKSIPFYEILKIYSEKSEIIYSDSNEYWSPRNYEPPFSLDK